jgi:hypothetical protein
MQFPFPFQWEGFPRLWASDFPKASPRDLNVIKQTLLCLKSFNTFFLITIAAF